MALIATDSRQMCLPLKTAYPNILRELLDANPRVIALDADLQAAMGTLPVWRDYPDRVIECGIAEANMVGMAAGLSSEGFIPFAHSFAAFSSRRAMDQFFLSCAYSRLNVKLMGSDPGIEAELNGGTHNANEDIAMMRTLPGVTVLDIADDIQLRQAMHLAAEQYGCFYIRLPRGAVPQVYAAGTQFTLGRAVPLRDGCDLTIMASGIEVYEALQSAAELERQGISAGVLDLFCIKPIDREAICAAARKTGAVVTAENHNMHGGLAGAVAEVLAETCPVPMERVANMDRFGDVGTRDYLMEEYGLTSSHITAAALRVLARKKCAGN